jgi:hypothetical protein
MNRLGVVAACLVCAVGVAVLTLGPSPGNALYDGTRNVRGLDALSFLTVEMAANVLLFVPVGFLLHAALPRLSAVAAWLLCTAAAVGVEAVQLVLPERQPTLRDAVLNSLGAALGVGLHALAARLRAASSRS